MTSSASPVLTVAIIVASTRTPRLCPYIARHIYDSFASNAVFGRATFRIEIVDIADYCLPLYNEPTIPSHLPPSDPTPFYVHEHTRAWSALIKRYDGYIFVTPQYNWSIPAALKNALDYLFHEWAGKPAGIVSYGSRGGLKAADHLRTIMKRLRMWPLETAVALKISETLLEDCVREGEVPGSAADAWQEEDLDGQLSNIISEFEAFGCA